MPSSPPNLPFCCKHIYNFILPLLLISSFLLSISRLTSSFPTTLIPHHSSPFIRRSTTTTRFTSTHLSSNNQAGGQGEDYSLFAIVSRKEVEIENFKKLHSGISDPLQQRLGFVGVDSEGDDGGGKRKKLAKALRRNRRDVDDIGGKDNANVKTRLSIGVDIKRKSPTSLSSKPLVYFDNPSIVASSFISLGVDFVVANIDYESYGGDLQEVKALIKNVRTNHPTVPVIMKDIIVDPIQLALSKDLGCDGVILISCLLGTELERFLNVGTLMNLDCIVEVHTPEEARLAIEAGAVFLLVNRYDRLSGNKYYPNQPFAILDSLPPGGIVTAIVTGNIKDSKEAAEFYDAGFDGVLIGKGFMGNERSGEVIRMLKEVKGGTGEHLNLGLF